MSPMASSVMSRGEETRREMAGASEPARDAADDQRQCAEPIDVAGERVGDDADRCGAHDREAGGRRDDVRRHLGGHVIEAYAGLTDNGFFSRRWRLAQYGFYCTGWIRNLGLFASI